MLELLRWIIKLMKFRILTGESNAHTGMICRRCIILEHPFQASTRVTHAASPRPALTLPLPGRAFPPLLAPSSVTSTRAGQGAAINTRGPPTSALARGVEMRMLGHGVP